MKLEKNELGPQITRLTSEAVKYKCPIAPTNCSGADCTEKWNARDAAHGECTLTGTEPKG